MCSMCLRVWTLASGPYSHFCFAHKIYTSKRIISKTNKKKSTETATDTKTSELFILLPFLLRYGTLEGTTLFSQTLAFMSTVFISLLLFLLFLLAGRVRAFLSRFFCELGIVVTRFFFSPLRNGRWNCLLSALWTSFTDPKNRKEKVWNFS